MKGLARLQLLLFLLLPYIIFGQKQQGTAQLYYGINTYIEGRPLLFEETLPPGYPISPNTREFTYSIGVEGEYGFTPRWSVYTALNYLSQKSAWEAEGLTTPSDVDPFFGEVGPVTGSLSFDIRKTFHQLNIPFLIGYSTYFKDDKLTFFTGPEGDVFLWQGTKGTITEGGTTRPASNNNQIGSNRFQFLWRASFSYRKKINDNIYLGIRPSISIHLKKQFRGFSINSFGGPSVSNKLGLAFFIHFGTRTLGKQ